MAAETKTVAVQLAIVLTIGLIIAGLLSVPMASFFYQVTSWDRTIFLSIAVLLSLSGLFAAVVPARRATSVNPLEALRE